METIWFCLVAVMLTGYVILDGFDLGAGIISLFASKNSEERNLILKSIGPFWDGNEVWLLASGGVLFFAFPALYAASFSGFYLPLMMVLWLLMGRGIAIEFRNHLESPMWIVVWDRVFGIASALLAIFFGAALGNVIRGVPLDEEGVFFLPLWTTFRITEIPGILDWYTVSVGVLAFITLALHGALWLNLKTSGELQRKMQRVSQLTLLLTAVLTLVITAMTFSIQPLAWQSLTERPWGAIFPLIALGSLALIFVSLRAKNEERAFLGSCGFILGMMTSATFSLFPYVLPSNGTPQNGLTVYNAAAPEYGLKVGMIWWIPGMLLATGYFFFLYRRFAGKVNNDEPASVH